MEFIFGLEPKGLLKAGEFYSKYWNDKNIDKITAFRAPQTTHENIRLMNLKNTEKMKYWYQYMTCCTIFNAWDCSCHTLNGADKDGDTIMTTDNPIIMSGVEELPPIVCMQNSAKKIIPTDRDLQNSNKNGFGEKIGTYTNRATTMEQMLCKFDKESEEYKELEKRIKLCMHFQQCEIDRIKGVKSPPMPKEWYDYAVNKIIKDKDVNILDDADTVKRKEFNLQILANKKPKFMIYIYDDLMKEYKKFKKVSQQSCLMQFKTTIEILKEKQNKSKKEIAFLDKVIKHCSVEECESLMNKICKIFEEEFDGILTRDVKYKKFDYGFLKPNVKISLSRKRKIEQLYKEYLKKVRQDMQQQQEKSRNNINEEEDQEKIMKRKLYFKQKTEEVCTNENELLAILLELLYKSKKSKQFVWDISGELIINNLLRQNNYMIEYPKKDEKGNFEYSYEKYSMQQLYVKGENSVN
jgi:hypothetical protein